MNEHIKQFEGKWKLVESENFEEFLTIMGANWAVRKLATSLKPVITVTIEGDNITIEFNMGPKVNVSKFTIDGETDQDMNGTPFKAKTYLEKDGRQMVTEMTPVKDSDAKKAQRVTREIVDGRFVQLMHVGDIVCKRIMERA